MTLQQKTLAEKKLQPQHPLQDVVGLFMFFSCLFRGRKLSWVKTTVKIIFAQVHSHLAFNLCQGAGCVPYPEMSDTDMFRPFHYYRITFALSLLLGLAAAGSARADGLVGFRNDTNYVIVVQSSIVVNNVVKKGKPQMLYPGEVALDGQIGTGTRHITIYDPKKPKTPLHETDVTVGKDVLFSIQTEATINNMKGQPPPPPKFKLVSAILPTLPPKPGTTNPGMAQPKKP